jgi:uncharacterized protein YigA (DUF484 family)
MTLSDTARAHVAQCHREDVSEELLLKLAAENDVLRAELAQFTADAEANKDQVARIHAAAQAELNRQRAAIAFGRDFDAASAIKAIEAINKAAQEAM